MVKPSKLFPEGISNSMRRCTARIFSALLAASLALAFSARVALASPIWEFNGSIFAFTHLVTRGRDLAIGIDDPALDRLLHQLGAVVTWKPGARYVLVATGEPTVVSFAIGQHTYDIGPIALRSNLAAFARGGEAFLDFNALLQALQLRAIPAGATTVLQPQIGTLDVRDEGDRIRVIARGALPLEAQLVRSSARQMTYAFSGVGSMLSPSRTVDAGGLTAIELQQRGSAVHPITYLTLDLDGSSHVAQMGSLGGRDIGIVIVPGAQVATSQASSATPMPTRTVQPTVASVPQPLHPASNGELPTISPWNRVASAPLATTAPGAIAMVTPAASVALAHITAIGVQSTATGLDVHITLTGAASFDWHHLRAPDNRFWIDLHGATLDPSALAPVANSPLQSVRVRQLDPQTVRLALSVDGERVISVVPSADGADILIPSAISLVAASSAGAGTAGTGTPAISAASLSAASNGDPNIWNANPVAAYVPTNPRLIVIDPGHGGSDRGASRHGVDEATLTLAMAKRLQAILVARGWQVIMTRETDVDVFAPNDSAEQELQARDNIANRAGARLLISIHANAYINAGPHGTTTYYAKPSDEALAQAVQSALAAQVGTKNDGIVRSHLYIPLHANMPACLVETAFLSNPDDFALLTDPAWRQRVAVAIADGIANYAGAPPPVSQPQQ